VGAAAAAAAAASASARMLAKGAMEARVDGEKKTEAFWGERELPLRCPCL
jgi:hypothetical protein